MATPTSLPPAPSTDREAAKGLFKAKVSDDLKKMVQDFEEYQKVVQSQSYFGDMEKALTTLTRSLSDSTETATLLSSSVAQTQQELVAKQKELEALRAANASLVEQYKELKQFNENNTVVKRLQREISKLEDECRSLTIDGASDQATFERTVKLFLKKQETLEILRKELQYHTTPH